eukprot:476165_1
MYRQSNPTVILLLVGLISTACSCTACCIHSPSNAMYLLKQSHLFPPDLGRFFASACPFDSQYNVLPLMHVQYSFACTSSCGSAVLFVGMYVMRGCFDIYRHLSYSMVRGDDVPCVPFGSFIQSTSVRGLISHLFIMHGVSTSYPP